MSGFQKPSPEEAAQEDAERDMALELEAEEAHNAIDAERDAATPKSDDSSALKTQLAETKDQLLRALADAENTRRRAAKDREDAGKYAMAAFARDLLEVADNFRRALEAVPDDAAQGNPQIQNLIDGISATERAMLQSFERHGIRKIEPEGEAFNPNFHEVMFETPVPNVAAGTIIQVIEPGYVLKDRLLRPARVGVAKATDAPPKEPVHIDESV